jgi:membrane associated rhomboid family serine protease
MFAMPRVTQSLIIINVLVYLLQRAVGPHLECDFALWSFGQNFGRNCDAPPVFHFWQLITYGFMHGSPTHIFFNMLALFMFGSDIERVWGERRYLIYYLVCVVSAGIVQLLVTALTASVSLGVVGASGGVFGVLLAFGMMFPRRMVMLLIPPIPMRAWVLVTLYGVIELFMGVTGTQPGVAHFAHLGGMLGGFLLIQYWRGRLPIRPGRR